jgi:hypothetical protein
MKKLNLLPFVILATLALYFGVSSLGMRTGMDMGAAPSCTMRGHGERMCPMTAADHLSAWENAFLGLPGEGFVLLTALLALLVRVQGERSPRCVRLTKGICGRVRDAPEVPPNVVIGLISRGILQPTVYG